VAERSISVSGRKTLLRSDSVKNSDLTSTKKNLMVNSFIVLDRFAILPHNKSLHLTPNLGFLSTSVGQQSCLRLGHPGQTRRK